MAIEIERAGVFLSLKSRETALVFRQVGLDNEQRI